MTTTPTHNTLSAFETAAIAANAAEDKKSFETLVLETGKVTFLAEYFVIAAGESPAQIKAMVDAIETALKEAGVPPLRVERDQSGKWSLLDYGDVVVHVMQRAERQFYQLEQFWNHANRIPQADWLQERRQAS